MMLERGVGLRPISNSLITINTFYVIAKGRVANILRPTLTSSIITPTITSYIVMKTIINMSIINRYTQKYTMVNWVIGRRVSGMGYISTSPITINIFFRINRVILDGIFRYRSTSAIINSSINPPVTIITTYI